MSNSGVLNYEFSDFEAVSTAAKFCDFSSSFNFENGDKLQNIRIAYETWGKMSPDATNCILVFSGMSSGSHMTSSHADSSPGWWEKAICAGGPIDTKRYFIICASMLGSCFGSTGPASIDSKTGHMYGPDFPVFTINDQAAAVALLMNKLGIKKLAAVVGLSMGGCLAKAFLSHFTGHIGTLVLVSSGINASPHARLWREIQMDLIRSDSAWNEGRYNRLEWPEHGMMMARKLGLTTYTGVVNLEALGAHLDDFIKRTSWAFISRFDPNCFLRLAEQQNRFEFDGNNCNRPDLVHIVASTSDILFPNYQQYNIASMFQRMKFDVEIDILQSDNGHDMFLREPERIGLCIAQHIQFKKNDNQIVRLSDELNSSELSDNNYLKTPPKHDVSDETLPHYKRFEGLSK